MLIDFQYSFTVGFCNKYATKILVIFPITL